jgi:hypothetical protein
MGYKFAVPVTVYRRHSDGKEPTRYDKVCSFYCLNMFRGTNMPIIRSTINP